MVTVEITPDILSKCENKPEGSPSGVECFFVKISREWGIKVYATRSDRDYAFAVQREAAKHDLAPLVGQCVDIGPYQFGYVTEVVITRADFMTHDMTKYDAETVFREQYFANRDDRFDFIERAASELRNTIGWHWGDTHGGNYGWCERLQKMVCIDFGCYCEQSGTDGINRWIAKAYE